MERKIWDSKILDTSVFLLALTFAVHFLLIYYTAFDLTHWSLLVIWPIFPLVLQTIIDTQKLYLKGKISNKIDYLVFRIIVIIWIAVAIISAFIDPFYGEGRFLVIIFMLGNWVMVPFFIIITYSLKKLMELSFSAKLIHFGISLFYALLAGFSAMMIMAMNTT